MLVACTRYNMKDATSAPFLFRKKGKVQASIIAYIKLRSMSHGTYTSEHCILLWTLNHVKLHLFRLYFQTYNSDEAVSNIEKCKSIQVQWSTFFFCCYWLVSMLIQENEKAPAFKLPIYVKNIQKGKHGSDSGVYDANGRYLLQIPICHHHHEKKFRVQTGRQSSHMPAAQHASF